jgi:hypothetical protein
MAATIIPIQGTFDIAIGRNTLRTKIVARRWAPKFNARAAAALTALGELILSAETSRIVPVRMRVLEEEAAGIEFSCDIRLNNSSGDRFDEAQARLDRATDELDMVSGGSTVRVIARIWVA